MASTGASKPFLRIFLNYRRDDSGGYALTLYRDLVDHFGEEQVFMDIDAIAPGENFVERIEETMAACDVVVAMIGRTWVNAADEEGNRRLDDPEDFVRLELERAVSRGIPLVPTLVHGARVPKKKELPSSLHPLLLRQAVELRDTSWEDDVERLVRHFQRLALRSQPAEDDGRVAPTPPPEPGEEEPQPVPPKRGLGVGLRAALRRRWRWVAAALAAVVAIVIVLAVVVSGSSSSPALAQSGQIAFLDDGSLKKMDPDGSHVTPLYPGHTISSFGYSTSSTGTFGTIRPTWSPDRRRIAFAQNGDIYVLSAHGKTTDITNTPDLIEGDPAWSPDGKQIAYSGYPASGTCGSSCLRIYVQDANGNHAPTELDSGAGNWFDYAPSWSPDGKLIAYASNKDDSGKQQQEIWVMNAHGSQPHRLTQMNGYNARPAWSPDGKSIAFQSDVTAPNFATCDPKDTCPTDIWVVDAQGSAAPSQVTHVITDYSAYFPVWTSTSSLVYESEWYKAGNRDPFEIFTINVDGSDNRKLTAGGQNKWPAVAP